MDSKAEELTMIFIRLYSTGRDEKEKDDGESQKEKLRDRVTQKGR